MIKKLYSFCRWSYRRKYLCIAAVLLAGYSFLMVKFFRQYARFGTRADESVSARKTNAAINNTKINELLVADICFAIHTAATYIPWENRCQHQAYQASIICRLYKLPYRVNVGFRKNQVGKIEGHAWTIMDGQMITGFCNPQDYTIQAVYV